MEVTLTFLTTALSLYLNIIYKWLILIAIYYINFLVTVPDLYLVLAPYLVNIICKDKALVYNCPWLLKPDFIPVYSDGYKSSL